MASTKPTMNMPAPSEPVLVGAGKVVAGIKAALNAGEFTPGQRLVEADLCLRFAAGRSQVREALNRLSSEGLVDLSRNKGAVIKRMTVKQAQGALAVAEVLMGLAARLAAQNDVAHAERNFLVSLADELAAPPGDKGQRTIAEVRANTYETIIRMANNEELSNILHSFQYYVLQGQLVPLHSRSTDMGLRSIIHAVINAGWANAETLMLVHMRRIAPLSKV